MFYPNTLNLKIIKYIKKKYSTFAKGLNTDYDESLLPIKYAKNTYNFNFVNGDLQDGIGITTPKFRCSVANHSRRKEIECEDISITYCWLFSNWSDEAGEYLPYLIVYATNGDVYYNSLHTLSTTLTQIEGLHFSKKPMVVNYKLNGLDTLIFVSENEGMFTWTHNTGVVSVDNEPSISSMCIHNERLFVTTQGDKRKMWFSDDLNPTNFNVALNEGGFIEIVDDFGRLNKVISFEGYVYIIRDYNISKLTAYADQENFSVYQLFVSNSKIYDKTLCVCGNRVIYLAEDGLYLFNGTNASKIELNINNMFKDQNQQYATAGYSDGYYYLACRLKFNDDKKMGCESKDFYYNNALIKYNIYTGEFIILRGYEITDICVINDMLGSMVLAVVMIDSFRRLGMLDMSGRVFDTPTPKCWEASSTDFNYPNRDKLVKEIYLDSRSDCRLKIKADNKSKIINIKGSESGRVIKPLIRGKRISLTFESDSCNNKISNPQVIVGIL